MEEKDIQLRSDEVNDFFTKIPSYFLKWGNTWICFILIALMGLANYLKYPDVISGNTIINSSSSPILLVSVNSGKLTLLKENLGKVEKGEIIAFHSEEGNIKDILKLKNYLKSNDILNCKVDSLQSLDLGKLYLTLSRFVVDLKSFNVYSANQPELIGIKSSKEQISYNQKSEKLINEQVKLKGAQVTFYKNKLEKDKLLLSKGMITERDVQNSQIQYNEVQDQYKNLKNQQLGVGKNNIDFQKQISDYKISKSQIESQKITELRQLKISILEEIELWLKTNAYISPMDGIVQYNLPLSTNQYISQGTDIFTITPKIKQALNCYIAIPIAGMGKVAIGQKVIIRLLNYPAEEFGVIYGKVKDISPSANKDKNYTVKVELDKGLTTSYKKTIEYKPNLEGEADIITKDKSFLNRVFEQFSKLFQRK